MARVWVTGDAVVDLIPNGETNYLKCPGGAPANVAVAISRLGGDSAFFGRVGQDPLGRFMKQVLKDEGVDTQYMLLDEEHRTSTVIVDLDDHGERSFTFMVKPSADQFLQPQDVPAFQKGEWLHVCSIALANEPSRSTTLAAMKAIKAAGGYVSFDPNLREEVWLNPADLKPVVLQAVALADVVKFSDDELLFLTDQSDLQTALSWLNEQYNLPLVVITQGKKGALVVHHNEQQLVTGKPVNPVDTTGAGDAFVGGLLAGLVACDDWHNNDNLLKIIRQANACGALATTAKGAMTALPTETLLKAYLAE
ncbi:PfkB domain protein [Tolumonas auensis DSM 9187]|uniref:PfkB domain protein n=1 Tax=Tolumonas auensis (strain DSM 9187 / NBRC 110442 / TA 4) TaxID=595494 RepID=C4LCS4_TOLAT|nr:aminoimidazole riboside kinase [Tolumonas auensis]ACQ92638.1 PfkB domain protein [Tolumonas auensis DSM 9187]NCB56467.1 aminoimidazole riboside kinase [Gammaproteobacteria bacterium]